MLQSCSINTDDQNSRNRSNKSIDKNNMYYATAKLLTNQQFKDKPLSNLRGKCLGVNSETERSPSDTLTSVATSQKKGRKRNYIMSIQSPLSQLKHH